MRAKLRVMTLNKLQQGMLIREAKQENTVINPQSLFEVETPQPATIHEFTHHKEVASEETKRHNKRRALGIH